MEKNVLFFSLILTPDCCYELYSAFSGNSCSQSTPVHGQCTACAGYYCYVHLFHPLDSLPFWPFYHLGPCLVSVLLTFVFTFQSTFNNHPTVSLGPGIFLFWWCFHCQRFGKTCLGTVYWTQRNSRYVSHSHFLKNSFIILYLKVRAGEREREIFHLLVHSAKAEI